MDAYLVFIILMCVIGNKFFFVNSNKEYLSKTNTAAVKGIFILFIVFSHSIQYVSYDDKYSKHIYALILYMGQLVVTLFLFYSGYGVFESFKKKGEQYIKGFPKKRILRTLLSFDTVVLLYLGLYITINRDFPIKQALLSLIGWESVGNSNWYIFDIVVLYAIAYFSIYVFERKKYILLSSWGLSIVFVLFMILYKQPWWYNTIVCFPLGMTYSFFKDEIDKILFINKKYVMILICTFITAFVMKQYSETNVLYYELLSLSFSVLIVVITVKIEFRNVILKWFGDNLFYVYIVQRLPMIILSKWFSLDPYVFFLLSFVFTVVMAVIVKETVGRLVAKIC